MDRLLADTGDQHFDLQLLRERLRTLLNRWRPTQRRAPSPSHRQGVEKHFYVTKGRLKVTSTVTSMS